MARSILSNDIRQCYELNKFTFSDAINTARTTAMQCITDKLNQGKMIADNAIKDIRTVIQDIRSAGQMIAECRQFLISFPSVAGAVAKVACLSQVCRSTHTKGHKRNIYFQQIISISSLIS